MSQKGRTQRWLEVVEESHQLKQQISSVRKQVFSNADKDVAIDTMMNKLRRSNQHPSLTADIARTCSMKAPSSDKKKSKRRSLQIEPTMDLIKKRHSKVPKFNPYQDEEDKENACGPRGGSTGQKPMTWSVSKSLAKLDVKTQCQERNRNWKNLLTPITEEKLDQSSINVRCIPKNFLTPNRSRKSVSGDHSKGSKHRRRSGILSTPTLPKKPEELKDASTNLGKFDECDFSTYKPKSSDISLGIAGCIGGVLVELSSLESSLPQSLLDETPKVAAKTKTGTTQKSIHDISQISDISRSVPHEQASSANLSGAFHSTFNYPLHSTFNDIQSGLNFSVIAKDNEQESQPKTHRGTKRKADSSKTDSFKMPETKRSKENSLRSKVNSPSLSRDEDSTFTFDEASEIDVDVTLGVAEPKTSPIGGPLLSFSDSDCDSSCLSICVDDFSFGQDWGDRNGHAALIDPTASQRRMMKRQTGQPALSQRRDPVGMSESDFLHDITQENMSLMATRASLPALSDLSDEESTINVSPKKKRRVHRESIQMPNCTLIGFEKTHEQSKSRRSRSGRRSVIGSERPCCPASEANHWDSQNSAKTDSHHDSGCSMDSISKYATLSDNTGRSRRISIQSPSVAHNLSRDQKKVLSKKIKRFSNNFQRQEGRASLQLQTLGHF